jgi:hypothetical protein
MIKVADLSLGEGVVVGMDYVVYYRETPCKNSVAESAIFRITLTGLNAFFV